MKFSESWLRTWTNPEVDTAELVAQLTMAGLEVDSVEPAGADFAGVVVAQITEVSAHPDAEKLRVCLVDIGQEAPAQIVCGAPNAAVGLKAACATIGAVLPGDFKIKKAKLRGVESSGMLCGADELGFESKIDGLWELPADAPVGVDLRDWLELNDQVIEVDLTPNRADCFSVQGVAREVALINGSALCAPEAEAVELTSDTEFPIDIQASAACPRYIGRVINDVDLSVESPLWMQERLRRSDIRVIDPVVDVTNYVMLELGQPMHAFDLDKLSGEIQVRMAKSGEKITLLDGKEIELEPEVLVIADQKGALAMAGIMGGENSGVSSGTQNILLESAFFSPGVITGKARQYGLHTESSMRFERGVDPQLQHRAIERATELLLQIVGGKAGPVLEHTNASDLPKIPVINLRRSRLELLIGRPYESKIVESVLTGLGCEVLSSDDGVWSVKPPSWRFDLELEVDLIEEIARVVGYNNIEAKPIVADLQLGRSPETQLNAAELIDLLVARGFREVVTYSFIAPELADSILSRDQQVTIQNPLASDLSVMRPSLIPGLLGTAARNLARQESRLRIFESGLNFSQSDEIHQANCLAALICGSQYPENWSEGKSESDFFQLKTELDAIANLSGKNLEYIPQSELSYLHPGQSATVLCEGTEIGCIGAVHPQLLQNLDIDIPAYVFEVSLQALLQVEVPGFVTPSKFPSVRRDIALLLDRDISAAQLIAEIKSTDSELLTNIRLFDIYTGQGIDSNKKSVALGLTFRDSSRTLHEDEISLAVNKIVAGLEQRLDAQQR
jgi:phenylalanyl-tRNA synthetase beta chain